MLNTLCIQYPDSLTAVLNLSQREFEQEARMALAVKLFESGRLTSGQAAGLVEMPRARFLLECSRWGANSVEWDDEEIQVELAGLND